MTLTRARRDKTHRCPCCGNAHVILRHGPRFVVPLRIWVHFSRWKLPRPIRYGFSRLGDAFGWWSCPDCGLAWHSFYQQPYLWFPYTCRTHLPDRYPVLRSGKVYD